ncbi:membrane-bound lytic murein transglycosylase A [Rhodoblastus acidophilus]|uniref:murein transglycosylase A n=1 Tax=Rhodoblastus acidophilus TaxID=1074 RepID=UPI002223EE8E|nr:MltA domain-containing protein [Rhodoblastus acidophilus]MCW2284425.1 membrane-bound lytic murein transglycosylase A [Rhodoblastus acidophilus]MCW2333272.1 membrane-bound lytic murein transglycosylase A [Rhodoblastus acidophilus]
MRSPVPRVLALLTGLLAAAPGFAQGRGFSLEPADFAASEGSSEALAVWRKSCARVPAARNLPELKPAAWKKACAAAQAGGADFFARHFRAYRVVPDSAPDSFFTGYYQPEIPGSLTPTRAFATPVYGRPPDLVTTTQFPGLTAARREGGALKPYPDRGEIEDGALEGSGAPKLVYLRDKADLFLAQVQGSARVRLPDGRVLRLSFAGRNGQPYTAIARILVQRGVATPAEMTMPRLIAWLRENGLEKGEAGDDLLRQNRSFVFFEGQIDRGASQPEGASGVALTPLRSIAVDKSIWAYGLPFFIDADLPWRDETPKPFRRVVIAQDTGSAIVGPGRADIYFGLGDAAGARAGALRHHGQFYLLLPKE